MELIFIVTAAWSPWSPWTECLGHDGQCNPTRLKSRRRECRSHYGRGSILPDNLACLEQGGKEVEFKNCLCPTAATPATTAPRYTGTPQATVTPASTSTASTPAITTNMSVAHTRQEKQTVATASQSSPSLPDDCKLGFDPGARFWGRVLPCLQRGPTEQEWSFGGCARV